VTDTILSSMSGILDDLKSSLGTMRQEQKENEERIKRDLELKEQ